MSLDYDDMERNDLLSGEPRYLEDEIRNTRFAMIFGALAAIFIIISMVMTWVLYYRERTRTFLWHAIYLCVALLAAGLAAAWGAMSGSAIRVGRPPSAFLTGFVFILAAIFAVLLFIESIWLVMYRPIHFSYLLGLNTQPDVWNKRMINGSSFEEGWRTDRRMMWWVVFFDIAAALCFTYIAYATRSVSLNRYSITKLALYVALIWAVWSAFMVCYWVEESYNYHKSFPTITTWSLLKTLKVLAVIAIVLATLNAIAAFLRSKMGYFIVSALEILTVIVFICAAGTLLRQSRNYAFNEQDVNKGCIQTMTSVHENDIQGWCPFDGKYLAQGVLCTKDYLVTRWEGSNELRSLNPSCCNMAKFFYLYPFMLTGYWSLFVIVCLGIAIACNIYLATANEYLTTSNAQKGIVDFIGIGLIVATIIGWCIYFIARKSNQLANPTNIYKNSYEDSTNYSVDGWTKVPASIVALSQTASSQISNDGCYAYDPATHPVPVFSTDSAKASCTDAATCSERVALLLNGGKFKLINVLGSANQGSLNSRNNFFPDCTSQDADYVFYHGTKDQISKLFSNLRVCPTATGTTPTVKLYQDQIKKDSIDTTGLTTTETNTQVPLTPADGPNCGNGFTTLASSDNMATACTGNCKVAFTSKSDSKLYVLKGKLFYLDNGASKTDINPEVKVEAYRNDVKVGGASQVLTGGIFTIADIEKYAGSHYILTLKVTDSSNRFQPKDVDILVEKDTGADTEVPAGPIRLVTKDGKVCPSGDTTCINAQSFSSGQISITVQDSTNLNNTNGYTPAADVPIYVYKGFRTGVPTTTQVSTDAQGKATLRSQTYGSYMIVANKTGYRPEMQPVDLQEATLNLRTFILKPVIDANAMRVVAYFNEPSADFDLNLKMASDDGKSSCTVSPTNKYCPYTASVSDVSFGSGEEAILVRRLAVANYVSFVSPASSYSGTCDYAGPYEANSRQYHAASNWNWDNFRQTRPLSTLDITTNTIASKAAAIMTANGIPIGLLNKPKFAETVEEARKAKDVISEGGVKPSKPRTATTEFGAYKTPGGNVGIFGWPNTPGDWKNTTVKDVKEAAYTVTGGSGKNTTLEIASVSTTPFNLNVNFTQSKLVETFTNGSTLTKEGNITNTSVVNSDVYHWSAHGVGVQTGKADEENFTNTLKATETVLPNGTIVTTKNQKTKIVREAASTHGNVSIAYDSLSQTKANGKEDFSKETTVTVVTGDKATDARSEMSTKTVRFDEKGLKTTFAVLSVSKNQTETNSTKTQVVTSTTTRTEVRANGDEEVIKNVTVLTTYNVGRADQAAKSSFTSTKYLNGNVVGSPTVKAEEPVTGNFNFNYTDARRRVLLTEAHSQGSTNANSIFVSCFTGYGDASLLNVNALVTAAPDISDCVTRIAKEKPDYTVSKLRSAVDEFYKKNPAYLD